MHTLRRHAGAVLTPERADAGPDWFRLGPTAYVRDRILVSSDPGVSVEAVIGEAAARFGLVARPVLRDHERDAETFVLASDGPGYAPDAWPVLVQARSLLGADSPGALALGLDHLLTTSALTPASAAAPSPGELGGTAAPQALGPRVAPRAVQWLGGAPEWRPTFERRSRPVTVALLDTALADHPWLPEFVVRQLTDRGEPIGLSSDPAGLAGEAERGHGTFMAGLIRQAAPGTQLASVPVVGSDGVVAEGELARILVRLADLVERAVRGDADGIRLDIVVITAGFFHELGTDGWWDGTLIAPLRRLRALGCVVVTPAGDEATDRPRLPGAFAVEESADLAPMLCVGGLDAAGDPTPVTNAGAWVNTVGPATDLVSTWPVDFSAALQPAFRDPTRPPVDPTPTPPPSWEYAIPGVGGRQPAPYWGPAPPAPEPPDRSAPQPPPHHEQSARYADLTLTREGRAIGPSDYLPTGGELRMRIGIGPLSRSSLNISAQPFPIEPQRGHDIPLHVLVSSTTVAIRTVDGSWDSSAASTLVLPGDGGPAWAPLRDGDEFDLLLPEEPGPARVRVSYYFHDAVVQSQALDLLIGAEPGAVAVRTDFTASDDFSNLDDLSDEPRLAVMVNLAGDEYTMTLRAPSSGTDGSGAWRAEADSAVLPMIRASVTDVEDRLRSALMLRAPKTLRRRRQDLIQDLRLLAPLGWQLYSPLVAQAPDVLATLADSDHPPVLSLSRASRCDLTIPWQLLYEISIEDRYLDNPQHLPVCPLVERWDDESPLVEPAARTCPEHAPDAENLLCPYGFWGYRHRVELLAAARRVITTVDSGPGAVLAAATTDVEVDQAALTAHLDTIGRHLSRAFPGLTITGVRTASAFRSLPVSHIPVVYFYCHGQATDRGTVLAIGRNDAISANDLSGWVNSGLKTGRRPFWSNPQPLIFVNACAALQVSPKALIGYLDAFIGAADCAAVIATEVRVHQRLAMVFATQFFQRLGSGDPDSDLGDALHRARTHFLAHGNLFGLAYTAYGWAHLKLTTTAIDAAAKQEAS